ncbi:hypothetical protein RI543_001839 [Arxiozyma heterogenica]|uniref:Protein kinase domain-containing protein n=1 Tax=Arxiozyma heterogenica TaxID=278026 RepID=A0AAN7WPP0_9SACH|nr:hypothetical protein RI543_001839 [Kazachstania heterogenica]
MMFWSTKTGISNKYSFSSSPTFIAEPWSVFTGRPKSSSSTGNNKVSIFVFDKKQFENYLLKYGIIKSKSSLKDKQLIQEGYEILRNEVNNLAKLKHPNILTLIEPLEEHSKKFMFVTEYVTGTLEDAFKEDASDNQLFSQSFIKNDIIIQRGIQQIITGLDFIHNRANFVHLNLQPKSIFINENLDWKISGLGHIIKLPQETNSADHMFPQYDPRIHQFYTLNLDYTAPELVYENTLSFKNDYFSLALLINFLYNGNNSIIRAGNSLSDYKSAYNRFEKKLSSLSWDNIFIKVPVKLRACMPKLMNRDIYSRYENITEFLDSDFFQDPLIKTLNFLDDLPTKTNEERVIFLDGLINLLPQYPTTLLQRKFLPILLNLLVQLTNEKIIDSHSISKDLEIIIKIGSTVSQLTFLEKIFPIVSDTNTFSILLEHSSMTLITNISFLKEKIRLESFAEYILSPLLQYILDKCDKDNVIQLQETLLGQTSLILDCYDFPTVKNEILPLLCQLFTKTTSLTIKMSCMTSFEILIERKAIDSYTCSEKILPLFKTMKTRDPRILLKSLALFVKIPTLITDEVVLVENFLPLLWNYSMASTLKKYQYTEFVKVINKLTADIQKSHSEKLNNDNFDYNDNKGINSNSNNFNKIIESKNNSPKPADLDNEASKNVNVAIIQPTKKKVGSIITPRKDNTKDNNTSEPSILSPKQIHELRMKRDTKDQVAKSSINTPISSTISTSKPTLIVSNSLEPLSKTLCNTRTFNQESTSNEHRVTTSLAKAPSIIKAADTSCFSVSNPINSPATNNNNHPKFPPGFSMSLQPTKKGSPDTTMPMLNNTTTDSLI